MSSNPPAHLLTIPQELRDSIYDYLYSDQHHNRTIFITSSHSSVHICLEPKHEQAPVSVVDPSSEVDENFFVHQDVSRDKGSKSKHLIWSLANTSLFAEVIRVFISTVSFQIVVLGENAPPLTRIADLQDWPTIKMLKFARRIDIKFTDGRYFPRAFWNAMDDVVDGNFRELVGALNENGVDKVRSVDLTGLQSSLSNAVGGLGMLRRLKGVRIKLFGSQLCEMSGEEMRFLIGKGAELMEARPGDDVPELRHPYIARCPGRYYL